jgi:SAM-dependent methyltransferase
MQTNRYLYTAQFYDLLSTRNAVNVDIAFYKQIIKPQSHVLEIGCGTGRVAIELYQHGCFITGIDISNPMLTEFRKKLRTSPDMQSRIKLHLCDMTTFDLGMTFDWLIFPGRVFQALTLEKQRRACLLATHFHMGAESRAVISMFDPAPEIMASWGEKGIVDFDIELLDSNRRLRRIQNLIEHDTSAQIIKTEYIFQVYDDNGVLEEYPDRLELGYLFPDQANELFCSSGFIIEQVYGGYGFQPLRPDVKKEQIYILRTQAG